MNEEIAAAVRSLESSRAALAGALGGASARNRRRGGSAADPAAGAWSALWTSATAAAKEQWRHGTLRSGLELARPVVAEAVRRQPWTSVTVAALCGAVAVWIVSTRRRLILSAAGLWWRTAGMAMLVSTALKLYEQFMAEPVRKTDEEATEDPEPAPAD